ncbi:MAG: hypothetical protein RL083_613 [Pseudomonadota bacterium]
MRTELPAKAFIEPWYRHRWPWLLMAGPATVLVAGFITVWISFSGADALVVDDYYKQGKAINQDLRRDKAAATLGLSASLRYDAAAGVLSGQLIGAPQAGTIKLLFVHPTVPAKDLRLSVSLSSSGSFSVSLPLLERARWQVQLEDEARQWRLNDSWSWPQQKNIHLQPQN